MVANRSRARARYEGGITVENIYYVDDQHQANFIQLTDHWERSKTGDKEYLQACYILALPTLFVKFKNVWHNYVYPTTWMWEYLDGCSAVDLSSGMIQLGKLSLNLWNGYKGFNLMDCLSTLDDELYKVAIQAIHIRK